MNSILLGRCISTVGWGPGFFWRRGFNARGQPIANSIKECLKMLTELPDLDYVPRSSPGSRFGHRKKGSKAAQKSCRNHVEMRGWYMILTTPILSNWVGTPKCLPARKLDRLWGVGKLMVFDGLSGIGLIVDGCCWWLPSAMVFMLTSYKLSQESPLVTEQAENRTAESLIGNQKYGGPVQVSRFPGTLRAPSPGSSSQKT